MREEESMRRREFVTRAAGAGAAASLFPATLAGLEREKGPGGLERRALGRTGEKLSVVGLGGVVVMDTTAKRADALVRTAIDAGVNYFDVAPSYGNAEDMLGPALEPYRKGVFLACKTQERTSRGALAELDASLEKLRTDHLDLYQHHAVTKKADVEAILGPGGAMEAFEKARKAGKVRFLGFSAHSVEAALALMDGYAFDTILFPVNYATWYAGNFGPQVLARAKEKGMGILCLKSLARRPWPQGAKKRYEKCWYEPLDTPEEAGRALRFTLSHPVTAAVPPGDEGLWEMALELARSFTPLDPTEAAAIKAQGAAGEPIFRYPSAEA
jgi:aryl-alcohol dehydrogenase-like predicted oxidoreductase